MMRLSEKLLKQASNMWIKWTLNYATIELLSPTKEAGLR